jgi:hypothetical protein
VGQDDEYRQHFERHRGHREEVNGNQVPNVVVERGSPSLRRWLAVTHHVLADCRLGDGDAELEQLAVDPIAGPAIDDALVAEFGVDGTPELPPVPVAWSSREDDIREGESQVLEPSGLQPSRYYTWAELMRRVFEIDVLECPHCGHGPMRILAAIHPPEATRAILEHLGLPSPILKDRSSRKCTEELKARKHF